MDNINNMREKFTNTFKNNSWHMGSGESKSGLGSSLDYTVNFRNNLTRIISEYNINNIFDCSCGDWNWMKEIKDSLGFYIGNDIVKELIDKNNEKYKNDKISFVSNDMLTEMKKYENKYFDLVLCRHTLEHLNNKYVVDVIQEIKRVSKYAIITSSNNSQLNKDINVDGVSSREINLDIIPYSDLLGKPIEKFYDSKGENKNTGCFGYLYSFT
jgi:2-polyprenyl-3-methyl-5-hydroxy-6-metoxy-1,4-benzoquinol methylase